VKHKNISFWFLFALALPMIWVAIIFAFGIQAHRQLVQHQMRQNKLALSTLVFTPNEYALLEWEHEKEFKWQGNMYDVESICKSENEVEVLVFKDLAEDKLIKFFRKGIKSTFGKGENGKEQALLVGLWFKSLYLPPNEMCFNQTLSKNKEPLIFYYKMEIGLRNFFELLHPPAV
jgi:hypothetical protein